MSVALLIGAAVVLSWWALRRPHRRPHRPAHQFLIDWDDADPNGRFISSWHEYNRRHPDQVAFLIRQGPDRLRAWCAHPSCPFQVSVHDDQEAKARRAYERFHRGGGR